MRRIKVGVALAVVNTILLSRIVANPATRYNLFAGSHSIGYYFVISAMLGMYGLAITLVASGVHTERV